MKPRGHTKVEQVEVMNFLVHGHIEKLLLHHPLIDKLVGYLQFVAPSKGNYTKWFQISNGEFLLFEMWSKLCTNIHCAHAQALSIEDFNLIIKCVSAIIDEDILRYEIAKKNGKKGYVRLITNFGPLNLELHCEMVRVVILCI